jgi:hypothetical protein
VDTLFREISSEIRLKNGLIIGRNVIDKVNSGDVGTINLKNMCQFLSHSMLQRP